MKAKQIGPIKRTPGLIIPTLPTARDKEPEILGTEYYLLDEEKIQLQAAQQIFDQDSIQSERGLDGGRGGVHIIEWKDSKYVLRQCYRGGMVRFLVDRYWWASLQKTRVWREWYLLAELNKLGLPVPVPVAARVIKTGLIYRAALLTELLPETETLAKRLRCQEVSEETWHKLGRTIRSFHEAKVFHPDFNAYNILLSKLDEPWVIDFDRAHFCADMRGWRARMNQRLRHSLDKLEKENLEFYFEEHHWFAMQKGYIS